MKNNQIIVFLLMFLVFFLAFSLFIIPSNEENEEKKTELTTISCEDINENSITAKVPAVDRVGDGVILDLEIVTMPGSGKVLTDIENLLFWVDTQQSIKTAKFVAEKVSGIDTSNINIAYTLKAEGNTSAVGGGSAGAILTLGTIAALKGKQLNQSIAITGSINESGEIGKIGGIEGKIKIAKENGATLFLLPKGQAVQEIVLPVRTCTFLGSTEICNVDYKKEEDIPLEKKLGINIREVSNITEAMKYYKI